MTAEDKKTVLIIEDDLDVADMLNAYFRVQGYEVITVHWGEDGVRTCQTTYPDLIILDIRLPDIDGFEVARRLRTSRRTENIPIIFLTEKRGRNERLHGLELGADDYITKPFDVQELRLRVRNALRRSAQGTLNNPITGLAEGVLVEEQLTNCIEASKPWAITIISLENLEIFRENYGFIAADDVLRAVSLMIQNSARDAGRGSDFVGHLNTTQIIIISKPFAVAELEDKVRTRLDQSLEYFYPLRDRDKPDLPDKRLHIRIGRVESGNKNRYQSTDHLKTELVRQLG